MKTKSLLLVLSFLSSVLWAQAAISAADASRLGNDLTPLGGEKAGNADGSIPAWTGGITTAPAGYTPGMHNPDQYAGKLSAGHLALLKAYPDYVMPVYATHRSASNPQRIYDATKQSATTAALTAGGNGITGAVIGVPFPIPQNGLEVIWNHLTRYRGVAASR